MRSPLGEVTWSLRRFPFALIVLSRVCGDGNVHMGTMSRRRAHQAVRWY